MKTFSLCLFLLASSCALLGNQETTTVEDRAVLLEDVLDSTAVVGYLNAEGHETGHCAGASVEQVIVTANHCVVDRDGTTLTTPLFVQLRGEEEWHTATVIAREPNQDLAVLQIPYSLPSSLTVSREDPLYGDVVAAIGHPMGLRWSYMVGRVNHPGRVGGWREGQVWFQFDAAIDRGASGGPVVNRNGHLVGITSFIVEHQAGAVHPSSIRSLLSGLGYNTTSRE